MRNGVAEGAGSSGKSVDLPLISLTVKQLVF